MNEAWKDAQGNYLPEIDREVVALQRYEGEWRVCFAHRIDKSEYVVINGVKLYFKAYDRGDWNLPDIKYWLDVELPKIGE